MGRIGMGLIALSLLASPAALSAQVERDGDRGDRGFAVRGHMDPAARALALRDELGLTDEQVRSLEAIQARYREANAPLLRELREAMAEHGLAMRTRSDLTPEQRERMRERMAERRAEWERLTPEERVERREQMRERMQEHRAVMREHREELRPVMDQMRENQREARSEVAAVLTEEQRATLRSMRAERREQMRERMREHRGDRDGRRAAPERRGSSR